MWEDLLPDNIGQQTVFALDDAGGVAVHHIIIVGGHDDGRAFAADVVEELYDLGTCFWV